MSLCFLLYSFDDFLWRQHVSSQINLIFFSLFLGTVKSDDWFFLNRRRGTYRLWRQFSPKNEHPLCIGISVNSQLHGGNEIAGQCVNNTKNPRKEPSNSGKSVSIRLPLSPPLPLLPSHLAWPWCCMTGEARRPSLSRFPCIFVCLVIVKASPFFGGGKEGGWGGGGGWLLDRKLRQKPHAIPVSRHWELFPHWFPFLVLFVQQEAYACTDCSKGLSHKVEMC